MAAIVLMAGGLLVICVVAFFAMTVPSKKTAIAALVLFSIFSVFFRPWYCFTPFDADAYDDPDVVSAAEKFRIVGITWILTSLFVLVSLVTAWRRAKTKNSTAACQDADVTTK